MITKFFSHGAKVNRSSSSVRDYLLDNPRLANGTARLIRGDNEFVGAQIDLCNKSNFGSTYTSGCLSFDPNEKLTEEQKQELMQSFEEALLPDFDPTRYACYWVEHTDKDRLELNFVFAKIDLATGKHLDVYQHGRDVERLNTWKTIEIAKHNLIDPFDPEVQREIKPPSIKRADGTKPTDNYAEAKDSINQYIIGLIESGVITNASEVKKFIEFSQGDETDPTGYQVKQNKTGISITDTTTNEKFRLQGKIYAKNFALAENTTSPSSERKRLAADRAAKKAEYDRTKDQRLGAARNRYSELSQKRGAEISRKFGSHVGIPKAEHERLLGSDERNIEFNSDKNKPNPQISPERITADDQEFRLRDHANKDNSNTSELDSVAYVHASVNFHRNLNRSGDTHSVTRNSGAILDSHDRNEKRTQSLEILGGGLNNDEKIPTKNLSLFDRFRKKLDELIAKLGIKNQTREERTRLAEAAAATKQFLADKIGSADNYQFAIDAAEQAINTAIEHSQFIGQELSSGNNPVQQCQELSSSSHRPMESSRRWLQDNNFSAENAQRSIDERKQDFIATTQSIERISADNGRAFSILNERDKALRQSFLKMDMMWANTEEPLTHKEKEGYIADKCLLELTPQYTQLQKEMSMKSAPSMSM